MDLLGEAGMDVSDWANYADGDRSPAANPKYCYEWVFTEPGKPAVLNLWFDQIEELNGRLIARLNMRESAERHAQPGGKAVWRKRAEAVDRALLAAFLERQPLRVIICDGIRRQSESTKAAEVRARALDAEQWYVFRYDRQTGHTVLQRGRPAERFIDQFSAAGRAEDTPSEVRSVAGLVYVRDRAVRLAALTRAEGCCEWCGAMGFLTPEGERFLETHHIVPLSENGRDEVSNVAALCPTHHREAHFGANRAQMRDELLARVAERHASPYKSDA